mmetsp:Transcript_7194/g.18379  ORF Transcript_7194/g.18379 Transcript_7194/m.18379 type:complete len:129 (-) Transcript_7194:30-416(-)
MPMLMPAKRTTQIQSARREMKAFLDEANAAALACIDPRSEWWSDSPSCGEAVPIATPSITTPSKVDPDEPNPNPDAEADAEEVPAADCSPPPVDADEGEETMDAMDAGDVIDGKGLLRFMRRTRRRNL